MKVLVCGGRTFVKTNLVAETLDKIHKDREITELVHTDCYEADRVAGEWAVDKGIKMVAYPANWADYKRKARMLRNMQLMMENPDIELVVCFKGGAGTIELMNRVIDAGIEFIEVHGQGETPDGFRVKQKINDKLRVLRSNQKKKAGHYK